MSKLYNRIEDLCKSKGVNISQMCRESGAARASLSDLKADRNKNLKIDTLSKIASYFGISVDDLVGEEGIKKEPSVQRDEWLEDYEKEFLAVARNLSPENRQKLLELARLYIRDQEAKK